MAHRTRAVRHRVARILLLLGVTLLGVAGVAQAAGGQVVVLTANGVVDDALAGYLEGGVSAAAADGAEAVVVQLDTPGGSLDATNRIRKAFLASTAPVIVWVAPSGARAASAGTFITLAANLAYMAPGTNIGAATPVGSGGEDITGTMGEKVLNDAIAAISATAEARGRPVDWAVSTVADARSYTATEAVAAGAVDGIAETLDQVLAAADGQEVTVAGGTAVTLDLAGAAVTEAPMGPLLGFLHLLSDPNIAFLLFLIGALGLATELFNTNLVTGILGAFALLLAFIGFGSLPLNLGGLLLLAFGFGLFVLESQIVSHGLLALGGIVCLALGAAALYTAPMTPTAPLVAVAPPVILVATATIGGLMGLIVVAAVRTRRMRATT
ncbi:MAG: ATP-dependent Clp protease proteolytic subunit, partial [Chloroflexi bacterium]|nr:ATP-dependent Clp protease proteolytic subunit [Chloroflexota bacterium]